jgi:hypothetical protein
MPSLEWTAVGPLNDEPRPSIQLTVRSHALRPNRGARSQVVAAEPPDATEEELLVPRGMLKDDPLELRDRFSANPQRCLEALRAKLAGIETPSQLVQDCVVVFMDIVPGGFQQDQVPGALGAGGHPYVTFRARRPPGPRPG